MKQYCIHQFQFLKMDNTKKKCPACKHMLALHEFDGKSKCNLCREKINGRRPKGTCETCGIRASFNNLEETQGRFCKAHECKSQPAFNHAGEIRGRFCKAHAEVGMVNVTSKRCETDLKSGVNHEDEPLDGFYAAHKEAAKVKYNSDLLTSILQRDGAQATGEVDEKELNRDSRISFTCRCGTESAKNFRVMNENGGCFCGKMHSSK